MTNVFEMPAVRAGMEQQARALADLQAAGERLLGWKVGVGAPASMAAAGIPAPLVGFLTSATVAQTGATVSLQDWVRPMLEPEIAIWIGQDVAPGADREQLGQAIGAIGPAIELADVDVALSDVEAVVAGDIFHRAVILGQRDDSRRGGRVEDLRVTVERDGEAIATTSDVTAATGSPVDLVAHVAAWLASAGQALRAGQVIIGGSVVPIIPVAAGESVTYRCEPLGTLSVSFT